MISSERIKQIRDLAQRSIDGEHFNAKEYMVPFTEWVDICNDALSWRAHCGPPLHCEGKKHDT